MSVLCFLLLALQSVAGAACNAGLVLDPSDGTCNAFVTALVPVTLGAPEKVGYFDLAIAALLAAQHINDKNYSLVENFTGFPSNFKLQLDMKNNNFRSPDTVKAYFASQEESRSRSPAFEKPHGVLGPIRSACAVPLSIVASIDQVPVLSYWASSPSLTDPVVHALFARTMLSDATTAGLMPAIMASFGWTRVNIYHMDDAYGNGYASSFAATALSHGVSVVTTASYHVEDRESIDRALGLIKRSASYITVAVTLPGDNKYLLAAANKHQLGTDRHVWVGAENWGPFGDEHREAESLFFASSLRVRAIMFGDNPRAAQFHQLYAQQSVADYQPYFNATLPPDLFARGCNDVCSAVYDGLWALTMGIAGSPDAYDGQQVLESMRSRSFVGTSDSVAFDEMNDRTASSVRFEVAQYRKDDDGAGRHWEPHFFKIDQADLRSNEWIWRDGSTTVPVDVVDPDAPRMLSADERQQRIFWTVSYGPLLLSLLGTTWVLHRFWVDPKLQTEMVIGFLGMIIPDFISCVVYTPIFMASLWRGAPLGDGVCKAVAVIHYGIIMATFSGPLTVSFITYMKVKLLAQNKFSANGLSRKAIACLLLLPWVVGFVLGGISLSQDLLGSYRGLYCYARTYQHVLTGGVTLGFLVVSATGTSIFYYKTSRLLSGCGQGTRKVVIRGASMVAVLVCTWVIFAVCGFMHLVGQTPPSVEFEMIGGIVVTFQSIFDILMIWSLPAFQSSRESTFAETSRPESKIIVHPNPKLTTVSKPTASVELMLKSEASAGVTPEITLDLQGKM